MASLPELARKHLPARRNDPLMDDDL